MLYVIPLTKTSIPWLMETIADEREERDRERDDDEGERKGGNFPDGRGNEARKQLQQLVFNGVVA